MRKCPRCERYVPLSEWPTYNGKHYTYCRACKKDTQRLWVAEKREGRNKVC